MTLLKFKCKVTSVIDEIYSKALKDSDGRLTGQVKPARRIIISGLLDGKHPAQVSRYSDPDNFKAPKEGQDFEFGASSFRQNGLLLEFFMGND